MLAAALGYAVVHPPALTAGGMDFNAFYCGSRILAAGENPYRYEPLRSCEHEHRWFAKPNDVVAAPLPPYALRLLTPIALLPYPQAGFLWFLLLLASALLVIWAILELTGLSIIVVGASMAIAVLLQSLPTGALAPIPLALLCLAAVALTRERWNAAAALLGVACIEPHVAAPAALAAFVLVRELRVRLAVVGATLVALSLLPHGTALNFEYLTRVLPQQARFELGSIVQFGLSSMLHNLGVPDNAALAIGSVQYALFIPLGIWLAARLRRQIPAAVVLVPIALAVTGGPYIHLTQIAAVLPLAFVVASRSSSPLAWAGVALLTLPWNLLNAIAPTTLVVPPVAEVLTGALSGQFPAGTTAYIANLLAYLGIACTLLGAASRKPR